MSVGIAALVQSIKIGLREPKEGVIYGGTITVFIKKGENREVKKFPFNVICAPENSPQIHIIVWRKGRKEVFFEIKNKSEIDTLKECVGYDDVKKLTISFFVRAIDEAVSHSFSHPRNDISKFLFGDTPKEAIPLAFEFKKEWGELKKEFFSALDAEL